MKSQIEKSQKNDCSVKSEKLMFFKHVIKMATANKVRTVLTFLGIAVSVFVLMMSVLRFDFQYKELQLQYSHFPQNTALLSGDIYFDEINDFSNEYRNIAVSKWKKDNNGILNGNSKVLVTTLGVNKDFLSKYLLDCSNKQGIYSSSLLSGRLFNDVEAKGMESAAIVNKSTAVYMFGDQNPLGKEIQVQQEGNGDIKSYKLVGVIDDSYSSVKSVIDFSEKKLSSLRITLYTPEKNLVEKQNNYDFVILNTKNKSLENFLDRKVAPESGSSVFAKSNIAVQSYSDFKDDYNNSVVSFKRSFGSLVVIISLCEAIALTIFMIFSIKERVQEVGIRKALGASDIRIVQQFMIEYIFIGIIATMVGVLFGYFVNVINLSGQILRQGIIFSSLSLMPGFIVFMFSVSLISILSLIPAVIARKTQITDALRFV